MSSPVFPNATGVILQDTSLTNARTINNTVHNYHGITGWDVTSVQHFEKYAVAYDALFNADARFDPPKCHPQTRTAVLDNIDRHISDLENPVPIIWLRGAAGAGKSAIAQTLAERWNDANSLAASFFLSRSAVGRNDKKSLVPTLAYQLMLSVPSTRAHIEGVINHDVGILSKNLQTQMMEFIVRPLATVAGQTSTFPTNIIIDGLDECCVDHEAQDHEEQQREILEAIAFAVQQKKFPLRFLISSRPERQIRECFGIGKLKDLTMVVSLDYTKNPHADIELYLQCMFDEIRQKHPSLGHAWPPAGTITELVQKSSGQFIYAAVVMRFLSSPRIDVEASLRTIMGFELDEHGGSSPFAELDALYTYILRSVSQNSLSAVTGIFEVMIYGSSPYSVFAGGDAPGSRNSPAWLAKFFSLSLNQLYQHLVDLHSVLDIPPENNATTPISFLHASFSEFLTNPARSGPFSIEKSEAHLKIQLIRLRHIFSQVISSKDAVAGGSNGFAYELEDSLDLPYQLPSQELKEGLEVLFTKDMERWARYVKGIHLDHLGTGRDERIRDFLKWSAVSRYIEKCHLQGISPPQPPILMKERPEEPPKDQPQQEPRALLRHKQRRTFKEQVSRWWHRLIVVSSSRPSKGRQKLWSQ